MQHDDEQTAPGTPPTDPTATPPEPSWPLPPAGSTPPPPPAPPTAPPAGFAPLAPPPPPPLSAPSAPPASPEPPLAATPYPSYLGAGTAGTPPTPPLLPPPPPTKPIHQRQWLAVALVASIIGAIVGAGVAVIFENNNTTDSNVTIKESTAAPGAATLGNVSIVQLVKDVEPAVVSIDVKSEGSEDQGTGMIITSNGEVVTNNHVIELFTEDGNVGTITVTEYGQTKALATTLIGYDATKDVALLKINSASNLPTVTFGNSTKAEVGDAVVAIGNALGLAAGTPTVTQGIVSALGRSVTAGGEGTLEENLTNLIQTDAAINPGNSGGPLIDTAGQVIGMNTAVAGTTEDGSTSQNIGFAIPIADVEALIPELQKGGSAASGGGYLGVDITTLTSSLRKQYGFTPTKGAVVLDVIAKSPAAQAGLAQGDVIVDIDFTPITSAETLQTIVQKDHAGQKIDVTYYQGGSKKSTTVTLGNQAEAEQQEGQNNSGQTLPNG
jgi:S1-C subfamily serine protease